MVRLANSLRTEFHPWWSSPLPWISANGGLGDDVFLMEYQRLPPFDSVTKVIIRSYHENLKTVRWGGGDDVIVFTSGRLFLLTVALVCGSACILVSNRPLSLTSSLSVILTPGLTLFSPLEKESE